MAAPTREVRRTPLRFPEGSFCPEDLLDLKRAAGASVSILIPARDEEATIGEIVGRIRRRLVEGVPLVDEIVVVDDGSFDATGAAALKQGARVVEGPRIGKGEAMAAGVRSVSAAGSPEGIVVFLDGDVVGFSPRFVEGLLGPLLCHEQIELVKASYRRPMGDSPTGGGRVTELVAKPALSLLFPELSVLGQPLSGEAAIRASLLAELELASGYGVEIAMLLDTLELRGVAAIAEVEVGERRHRNRSLEDLVPQAHEVLAAVLARRGEIR